MSTRAGAPAAAEGARGLPSFDVREIPFSARGSWLDLSPVVALHTTADDVHLVSHQTGMHPVLRLVPTGPPVASGTAPTPVPTPVPTSVPTPVPTRWEADPSVLRWVREGGAQGKGVVEAAFDGTDAVRLRGSGLGLRLVDPSSALTPFTGLYLFEDPIDGSVVLTSYETGQRYRVTCLAGRMSVVGGEALGRAERAIELGGGLGGESWEAVVEELGTARDPFRPVLGFDELVALRTAEFARYRERLAPWPDAHAPGAALAAYVLWSATVRPAGFLRREAILMSKHWMDKVWSWDHCFNALALAPGDPDAAVEQMLVMFDHQDEQGALPDSVAHSEVLRNFVKPPVHGWAVATLRAIAGTPLRPERLRQLYDALARWTRFWLEHRRVPGHALAHYQHGNDSGWDNATTFDAGRVLETPDLAAFLVVQLDVLAGLADELADRPVDESTAQAVGRVGRDEAAGWRVERDAMAQALLGLWDGTGFAAVHARTGERSRSQSLLPLLSLLAAEHLPRDVVEALVVAVGPHLTAWGPATQMPGTPQYESDGYWRGPIWAPSTVLLVEGLRRAGRDDLADDVSARFRRLCEVHGFAENFDALEGTGLRDRAYTWTASAYLYLAGVAAG